MDYAALSNNRRVSDQLGTFGRQRIHVHMLPATKRKSRTFATRETDVVSERKHCSRRRIDTHRSNFRCRINAQTKRRQSHVNAGMVPESENRSNVRSTCGWLYKSKVLIFRFILLQGSSAMPYVFACSYILQSRSFFTLFQIPVSFRLVNSFVIVTLVRIVPKCKKKLFGITDNYHLLLFSFDRVLLKSCFFRSTL